LKIFFSQIHIQQRYTVNIRTTLFEPNLRNPTTGNYLFDKVLNFKANNTIMNLIFKRHFKHVYWT
jgi:hypothetical protein